MKMSPVLPESFLRCLSPADRKKIGQHTADEVMRNAQVKNERHLQTMIVNLLRLHGIEPLWHRTDRRSAATVGWPDITFCVGEMESVTHEPMLVEACAWEVKLAPGNVSIAQQQMHIRLSTPPNAWRVKIIYSVDQALKELRELGIAPAPRGDATPTPSVRKQ